MVDVYFDPNFTGEGDGSKYAPYASIGQFLNGHSFKPNEPYRCHFRSTSVQDPLDSGFTLTRYGGDKPLEVTGYIKNSDGRVSIHDKKNEP